MMDASPFHPPQPLSHVIYGFAVIRCAGMDLSAVFKTIQIKLLNLSAEKKSPRRPHTVATVTVDKT